MGDVVNELVWNRENGQITYKGVRYLLIRPETISVWQEAMEEKFPGSGELMFSGGLTGGRLSSQGFARKLGLTPRQMVEFMTEMGGQIGWGRFVIEDLREDLLAIKVYNSPFASGHSPSSEGVCHLIRGVFAGVAEAVLGGEVSAKETKCLALQDSYCCFEFAKKEL